MRKIIFVGDSLTWGENPALKKRWPNGRENPETKLRWPEGIRWTSLMERNIKQRDVISISIPGLAIKINPWNSEDDWCNTDHLFIEKSLKSFEEDIDDVFLFLGTNNYGAITKRPKNPQEITKLYQELIDSIWSRIDGIKNIYIMLLPNMSGSDNGIFKLSDLNKDMLNLKNVQGFVDLSQIKIESEDNVHFSEKNNKEVADKILSFIKEKGDYE